MLQQYRFENFNRLSLAAVPGDECLYSRNRDLYKALALPIADCDARKFLVECFKLQQDSVRESLSPVQVAVLQVLESCIHENLGYATSTVSSLTVSVNWRLQCEREPFRASPRQVGYILNSLGLPRGSERTPDMSLSLASTRAKAFTNWRAGTESSWITR